MFPKVGVNSRVKPDKHNNASLVCPRCHNTSVIHAKDTQWFELFFIPLIPFSSKHIYICNICQWRFISPPPNQQSGSTLPRPYAGGWAPPNHSGYHPVYIVPSYSKS
ncbi:hypothetical protein FA15DRAFT_663047 [Coprinopsis marcescibilis]|uniref:Zinc-ribbon 15 domain-containing protein n=1 Tax=Coprinopsis marcescibilis TaxID=230819 RepID=A0A5C3LAZ3_COPMA|nr:hypothetical protein FA15DRAFT_663047 [Coprinopsis marcescibilis]